MLSMRANVQKFKKAKMHQWTLSNDKCKHKKKQKLTHTGFHDAVLELALENSREDFCRTRDKASGDGLHMQGRVSMCEPPCSFKKEEQHEDLSWQVQ